MNETGVAHEVIVWAENGRTDLISCALDAMSGVEVLGIGGPSKSNMTALAEKYGATPDDDLRKMQVDQPAESLLLATSKGVSRDALNVARENGTMVLALEPLETTLDLFEGDEGEDEDGESGVGMILIPWMRMSPAWVAAADPQEVLGEVRSANVQMMGRAGDVSLHGHLRNGLDLLLSVFGFPDTIDAALASDQIQLPEKLSEMEGVMTANLRFGGEGSACLQVSDRGAVWSRRVTLMGTTGQLECDDEGYRLFNGEGELVDESVISEETMGAGELVARQWEHLINRSNGPAAMDGKQLDACCQTALLSCRTFELESPQTMLRMYGG